jgi:hypothetical protein
MSFIKNSWNTVCNATNKAVPVVVEAAATTLSAVDAGCMGVNAGFVTFLTKYPGIAMTLSPSSMIKIAVANHVDDLMKRTDHRRPGVVINMTTDK